MKKLRICNLYPDINTVGRNDGNPMYLTHILKKMGHDVEHIFPSGDISAHGKFDLYLWADWGEDALGMADFVCPRPNAYWVSDSHLGFEYRLKKAREFDYVFVAQEADAKRFEKAGIKNVFWLPHAVEPAAYHPSCCIKKYDICFVGHINDRRRAEALDTLFKAVPNFWLGQRRFEEAAEKYSQSKIVFNQSIKDDVNMRTFEVLATKSFLLTEKVDTLDKLFVDGKHLVMYSSPEEMVEKAKYYLEHDEEREKIAEAGYVEVMSNHTFQHRASYILAASGLVELEAEKIEA